MAFQTLPAVMDSAYLSLCIATLRLIVMTVPTRETVVNSTYLNWNIVSCVSHSGS